MPATITRAVRVSAASAIWTLTASATAIVVGVASGSVALIAFGAVQLFDFAADVVLVVHFRADGGAEHLERVVLRVVAAGLLAVGSVTIVVSVLHLVRHDTPSDSAWSVALAAASVVALTALAIRKRHLAVLLPSHGLRADGNLTAIGAALAAVTVAGTLAASAFGWWWADPVAAMVIAAGALYVGATTRPARRTGPGSVVGVEARR
jgi:divalent metal cation (Fe/Co/Zn/Cd) transporter